MCSFMVLGGETENFMQFPSQRGKCNDIDSTNTIKRNLMIINKYISAIVEKVHLDDLCVH